MKILLVQSLDYLYFAGGAHKANRLLVEALAGRGHDARVIAPAPDHGGETRSRFLAWLDGHGIAAEHVEAGAAIWSSRGVTVHTVFDGPTVADHVAGAVRAQAPDRIIVTEDLTGSMLRAALAVGPDRVVYLAHSQVAVPFGPESFQRDAGRTALLRRCARIIAVSQYVHDYLLRFGGGLASTVLRFPAYGPGPFPSRPPAGVPARRHDRGHVLMINPSAFKGLAIFLGLARRLPDIPFAAVPTWATSDAERAELSAVPNVRLLPLEDDLDRLYAGARVLLVPSLLGESFGQVIVEAMLRGIPVVASDVGGIPEAKLGVDYLVPVRRIEGYRPTTGASGFPDPIIPDQNLAPWVAALGELLASADRYGQVAAASQQAAARFAAGLGWEAFETFLAEPLPHMRGDESREPP